MACEAEKWKVGEARRSLHLARRIVAGGVDAVEEAGCATGSIHEVRLDAFSSDAIPVHLLTLEAFEAYQQVLAPDSIIAV